jgi:formiminotetrahydrofolate cyclodeaminase
MTLSAKPLTAVLEDFRSSAPTPGGGSAAALAGALGASLFTMVAGLPRPRAASDDDLLRLREAGERCAALSRQLENLIDRDSEAYEQVMSAYRMPKAAEAEKAARAQRIEAALRAAIETPLDVMRACAAALDDAATLLALGNANASSDVKVGVALLGAGLRGAQLNVEINLDGVKDGDYAAGVRREVARLIERGRLSESGGTAAPSAPS